MTDTMTEQTTIRVRVDRNPEWVRDQRLQTGRNVPPRITVDVDPADLSADSRLHLLAIGGGAYCDAPNGFGVDSDYEWNRHSCWKQIGLRINSNAPSPAEIDAALADAVVAVQFAREATAREREEREAEQRREREEREAAEAKRHAARELLAGEIDAAEKKLRDVTSQHDRLAQFVAAIANSAKLDACRELDMSMEDVEKLHNSIYLLP